MIQLAVLDMAGTTVSDDGTVERAFVVAMGEVGVPADDPAMPGHLDVVHATMGMSKLAVFRRLVGEGRAEAATAAFERAYARSVAAGELAPIPGAEEAMAELRDAGVRVCLTTGFAPVTRDAIVDALGWRDAVDLLLSPGPGVRGRPFPDMVLAAVLALEVDDVRAVAVAGDTCNDLLAGTRAGASIVAGVLTGAHDAATLATAPHTHLLASVADLPDLVLGP